MKQLYLRQPKDLVLRETPIPKPGPGEVVVQVKAALTCGTDLKTYHRGHPKFPMPTPFGHEFSGDIAEIGEGVEGWRVGQPVMLAPTAPCGECSDCKRGLENLCPFCMEGLVLGAFAEFVKVPPHIVKRNLYPKPDSLDYFHAAVMEPLACVVYGHELLNLGPEDSVVVIGAGPIGLMHQMLARQSAGRVYMLGRRDLRLETARVLGADAVVEVGDESIVPIVHELTGGVGATCIIECTGQPQVWVQAIEATAVGGTTMLFGGCKAGSTIGLDLQLVQQRALTIKGVFHFTPAAVARSRELLATGTLPVERLITDIRPMSDFENIFSDLIAGRAIKFGLQPAL